MKIRATHAAVALLACGSGALAEARLSVGQNENELEIAKSMGDSGIASISFAPMTAPCTTSRL